jgi:hypothetical protein
MPRDMTSSVLVRGAKRDGSIDRWRHGSPRAEVELCGYRQGLELVSALLLQSLALTRCEALISQSEHLSQFLRLFLIHAGHNSGIPGRGEEGTRTRIIAGKWLVTRLTGLRVGERKGG